MSDPIRVCHIINDLDIAGAEIMLLRLLKEMNRERFDSRVISLTTLGEVAHSIQQLGIPVQALNMRPARPDSRRLFTLIRWIKAERPDIIQSWMYHSDLVGGIAAKISGIPIIWGIHNSTLDPQKSKRRTMFVVRMLARLSKWMPERIVSCSQVSSQLHKDLGYEIRKITVIPNGFDLNEFQPDESLRMSAFQELSLPSDTLLIGMVGRYDPQKDPRNFILAAAQICQLFPKTHFLMCGRGMNDENRELVNWIRDAGMEGWFHLMGSRKDVSHLMAALDVFVSPSAYGEAFPLVVGEAMACGVPCVVTDVGDSAEMVAGSGLVVPPRNDFALAKAVGEILSLDPTERKALGAAARSRVENNYSIAIAAQRYEKLYEDVFNVNSE